MASSQILKFYENSNVFITGGTGFLGKILIEKLLRSTSVSTLYILVRKKKGKNAEQRMKELFEDVIFQRLQAESPKYIHRVVGISGDVSFPDLGMSQTDRQILIDKIDVVFHAAATVRFDENLKLAYNVNVSGAGAVLDLGKQMKNLKCLIHISTAFSNCYLQEIDEKFYDCHLNYDEVECLLEKMTESQADFNTSRIIGPWPNTYTFTKALAESMVSQTSGSLPVGVFRPSIVISTNKEPIEGWIDNMYGPTGVCAGVSAGLLRVIYCDRNKKADLVPVDMCVSALIAAAWDTSQKSKDKRSPDDIPIFNYVGAENAFAWSEYCTVNQMYNDKFPSNRCIWPITLHLTNNMYVYMLMKLLFHLIPALVIDLVSMLFFRNFGMLGMYKKIHKFSDVLGFFSTRQWKFSNDNVIKLWNKLDESEKKIFFFDMTSIDWWAYYKHYLPGIRRYIMKESTDTLEAAEKRQKLLHVLRIIFFSFLYFFISIVIWTFLPKIWFNSSTPCIGRDKNKSSKNESENEQILIPEKIKISEINNKN